MQSLKEKMAEAYRLSCRFDFTEGFTDAEFDVISGWQDGLMHKYYENHTSGRCSLQAFIDFDVGEFEAQVDRESEQLKALAKKSTRK